MDNRIFNVNGKGLEFLTQTLALVFKQKFNTNPGATGWKFVPDKGFVILWTKTEGGNNFPAELSAEEVAPMVFKWLSSEDAKKVKCEGWDKDADHDGHNSLGWRVYCEDWGHIGGVGFPAICAVKPAYMWHGK